MPSTGLNKHDFLRVGKPAFNPPLYFLFLMKLFYNPRHVPEDLSFCKVGEQLDKSYP
jgi:hypothetical protein